MPSSRCKCQNGLPREACPKARKQAWGTITVLAVAFLGRKGSGSRNDVVQLMPLSPVWKWSELTVQKKWPQTRKIMRGRFWRCPQDIVVHAVTSLPCKLRKERECCMINAKFSMQMQVSSPLKHPRPQNGAESVREGVRRTSWCTL